MTPSTCPSPMLSTSPARERSSDGGAPIARAATNASSSDATRQTTVSAARISGPSRIGREPQDIRRAQPARAEKLPDVGHQRAAHPERRHADEQDRLPRRKQDPAAG